MALLSKNEELKRYDKVAGTLQVDTILPYIEAAERSYIKPLLGDEQYSELHTEYLNSIREVNPVAMDAEGEALLHECRRGLVQLTLFLAAETLAVNVSASGIKRSEGSSEKTAFQYQEIAWKSSKLTLGLQFLDDLDAFLLKNLDDYTYYATSTAYTERFSFLVTSVEEFNRYTALSVNRYTFKRLFPIMRTCQNGVLRKTVGATLLTTILDENRQGSLSARNAELIEIMRNALVNYSLSKALKQLSVKVDHTGITVFEASDKKTIAAQKAQSVSRIEDLQNEFAAEANAFLNELEDETYTPEETSADVREFLPNGSGGFSAI